MHGARYRTFIEKVRDKDSSLLRLYPQVERMSIAAKTVIDIADGKKPYPGAANGKRPPRGQFGPDLFIDEDWNFSNNWPAWGGIMLLWKKVDLGGKY